MIRNSLRNVYRGSSFGYWLIHPPKLLFNFYRFHIIPEKRCIKRMFRERLGYEPNLENPKTFNEKIQWLKLNDRTPLHTLCADKYAVRDYIKEKIGERYLVPLLYHTKNPSDIVPENLPDVPFILKANHNSGGAIIVEDKAKADFKTIRKNLRSMLRRNYYYLRKEWQYKDIEPSIVVEKLLLDEQGHVPVDYKFHCFNGKLGFIQVDLERFVEHKRNLYDPDWNLLDAEWKYENGVDDGKPPMLEEMKALAEVIAKDFRFARVDFYNLNQEVYFGEITFHPESGFGPFSPQIWDEKFGDALTL